MILRSLSLSVVLAVSACSDPAQNAPAAQVRDPAPTPEPTAGGTTLNIDRSRSSVGFTGAKVTAQHDGTFSNFSGTIGLDPQGNIENSSVNVTIQIGSVQIEPQRLHDHLLTADLFDAATYPTATFQSTRIAAGGEGGSHTVTGNLTLHGQTHEIQFPATIEISASDVHARAEFSINRRDFGIIYPGMPDDLIRDGVVIRFDVHAPRS